MTRNTVMKRPRGRASKNVDSRRQSDARRNYKISTHEKVKRARGRPRKKKFMAQILGIVPEKENKPPSFPRNFPSNGSIESNILIYKPASEEKRIIKIDSKKSKTLNKNTKHLNQPRKNINNGNKENDGKKRVNHLSRVTAKSAAKQSRYYYSFSKYHGTKSFSTHGKAMMAKKIKTINAKMRRLGNNKYSAVDKFFLAVGLTDLARTEKLKNSKRPTGKSDSFADKKYNRNPPNQGKKLSTKNNFVSQSDAQRKNIVSSIIPKKESIDPKIPQYENNVYNKLYLPSIAPMVSSPNFFPPVLHKILSIPSYSSIASWNLPFGHTWSVHDPARFLDIINRNIHLNSNELSSIDCLLSSWGFKTIMNKRHPNFGAYYNIQFIRENPLMCMAMHRTHSPIFHENEPAWFRSTRFGSHSAKNIQTLSLAEQPPKANFYRFNFN